MQSLLELYGDFLKQANKNLEIDLLWNPVTSLKVKYSKLLEHNGTETSGTSIFKAALFTIHKICSQPRFPSSTEWISKRLYGCAKK